MADGSESTDNNCVSTTDMELISSRVAELRELVLAFFASATAMELETEPLHGLERKVIHRTAAEVGIQSITENDYKSTKKTITLFREIDSSIGISIFNELGKNISHLEMHEQRVASRFITPSSIVLELGARYGAVSCTINQIQDNKKNLVVVEPDERVWASLKRNREANSCEFAIVEGFVSLRKLSLTNLHVWNGYGTSSIENDDTTSLCISLEQAESLLPVGSKFNTLFADCEGYLLQFLTEFPYILDQLDLIIYEMDYSEYCDYDTVNFLLASRGYIETFKTSDEEGSVHVWQSVS